MINNIQWIVKSAEPCAFVGLFATLYICYSEQSIYVSK